jgi:hypothetical protein
MSFEHPPTSPSPDHVHETFLTQELPKQFLAQIESLRNVGLLEHISDPSSDELVPVIAEGIKDMRGIDRKLPTIEAIQKHFSQEKYTEKIEQGFTRLLIVPFGYPIETLKIRYQELLLKKHKAGKLLDRDGNKLDLDTENPLYFFEGFNHADETGSMIYYPKQFDKENHGGKTKEQLLQDTTEPFPGFHVLLIKPDLTIPRKGNAKTTASRTDLEAGQSSRYYLKTLQANPHHHHEQGFTLEDQLTLAILELEQNNKVIDDYSNDKDSVNFVVGNYHTASGGVPVFYWCRYLRQACVSRNDPGVSNENSGACVAVG